LDVFPFSKSRKGLPLHAPPSSHERGSFPFQSHFLRQSSPNSFFSFVPDFFRLKVAWSLFPPAPFFPGSVFPPWIDCFSPVRNGVPSPPFYFPLREAHCVVLHLFSLPALGTTRVSRECLLFKRLFLGHLVLSFPCWVFFFGPSGPRLLGEVKDFFAISQLDPCLFFFFLPTEFESLLLPVAGARMGSLLSFFFSPPLCPRSFSPREPLITFRPFFLIAGSCLNFFPPPCLLMRENPRVFPFGRFLPHTDAIAK